MKVIRTTIVHPRKGYEKQVATLLRELGDYLASQPGFIEGYEAHGEGNTLGRISVWATKEAADHAASLERTIAIRSRIYRRVQPDHEEALLEVDQEHRSLVAA